MNNPAPSEPQTIHARLLNHEDVATWVSDPDQPLMQTEPLSAYMVRQTNQHGTTLTPVTVTPTRMRIIRAKHDRHQADNDDPTAHMGAAFTCDVVDMFGSERSTTLYTSENAATTAREQGTGPAPSRYVTLCVEDATSEEVLPLTPVYGSQLTLSVIVKDTLPEDLERRVLAMLEAEFGDELRDLRKVKTRPVANTRVDVHKPAAPGEHGRTLAAGILEAEVTYLSNPHGVTVTEAHPDGIMIGT